MSGSAASGPIGAERLRCTVYRPERGPERLADLDRISDVVAEADAAMVWLDVTAPCPADFAQIQEEFGLHPLAIEDALKANQEPKLENYGAVWFLVIQGVRRGPEGVTTHEIAVFVGANFVVTARADPAYPLDEFERRWNLRGAAGRRTAEALALTLLDAVADGYLPVAAAFEAKVEALEAALLGDPRRTSDMLLAALAMKKELGRARRAIAPMRTLLAPPIRGDVDVFSAASIPYFRDVDDHVVRALAQLDAARMTVDDARETHVALVSHRQGEVSRQLTLVATVFLPLTFVTGFFGQNFGFLVERIASPAAFWILGVGSEILATIALVAYFRYRRWS